MIKDFFTKRNIIFSISAIVLFGLIGFVEKKTSDRVVNNIIVKVKDEYGNYFVDEYDVHKEITLNHTDSIVGKYYNEINLKTLEKRIRVNKFVEHAEVYKDHKGNLLIEVIQYRPIARIIQSDGPHAYIGNHENILPVSEKFTARVVIVDGEKAGKLLDSTYRASNEAKEFFRMLSLIDKDKFLKAQISQITFSNNGEVEMRPQVGDEIIFFGSLEDMEVKFKKIKIFYKRIIQSKGFNKYKTVNLKYKDQIICE